MTTPSDKALAQAWRNRFISERMNAYPDDGHEVCRAKAEADANDFEDAFIAASANRASELDAEKGGDANVEAVREKLLHRSRVGLAKYGVTTERTDLTRADWLTHLQEELMDACVYIEAARLNELSGNSGQLATPPAQAAEAVESYSIDVIEQAWGDTVPLTKPAFDSFRDRLAALTAYEAKR